MNDYEKLTREELIAELEKLQSPRWARDAAGLNSILDELRVHQVELEMQNRELREAQQELEESRNRYADLYDFAPVGYVSTDDKGLISDINLTGATMLGVERGRLIGMPLARYVWLEDRGWFMEHMRRCRQTEEKAITELRLITKDSTAIEVELSSVLSRGAPEDENLCRTVIVDISERKRIEEEMRKANEELRSFAHTIAHDLQGSLAIIEGFSVAAFSALEKGDSREELESLEHIVRRAHRAQGYIQALMEYAMVVHEEGVISYAVTEEVLMGVLMDYEEQIKEKGVDVVIEQDLPPIRVAPIRLRQVFLNLIDNAIKYMGDRAGPRIEIGARTEGETVILHIYDNGPGIPREDQDGIFQPFKRFTTDDNRGTGIGLATVKRVVEGWGGSIRVKSRPGEGATFYFSAPVVVYPDSCP